MPDIIAIGEPLEKGGAYAMQGGAGTFVERIDGCYANVVGLPLCEVSGLLAKFDVVSPMNKVACVLPDKSPCPRLIDAG